MFEQSAWIHGVSDYPMQVKWLVGEKEKPVSVGFHIITEKCFYLDRYGSLKIDLKKIVPEAASKAA